MLWVVEALAALGLLGGGGLIARRVLGRRADAMLADGIATLQRILVENLGGTAHVEVEGEPLAILLGLRNQRLPAGRVVVERCRLPNGLAVRHAELTTAGGDDTGHLVVRVSPHAITAQLNMPGVRVDIARGRLRLVLGVATLTVKVRVVEGRVVLSIPVTPPPFGSIVSAGLTELVPRPPEGVELHDVEVEERELVIRAIVDMQRLVDLAPDFRP